MYAVRDLTQKEVEEYDQNQNASRRNLLNRDSNIENAAIGLEHSLECIGIVAITDELREEVGELIQTLNAAEVNLGILTGDTKESALNTAINCGMIPKGDAANYSDKIYELEGEDDAQVRQAIRNILSDLKRKSSGIKGFGEASTSQIGVESNIPLHATSFEIDFFQKRKIIDQHLVVRGSTFDMIMSEPFFKSHFAFILLFCRVIVGYEFSPTQKAGLVKFLRKKVCSVNEKILAIGDGFNDIPMFKSADISIEIDNLHTKNQTKSKWVASSPLMADIIITSLKSITDLFCQESELIRYSYLFAIVYSFAMAAFFTVPTMVFSAKSNYSALPLFESWFLFLFYMVICPLSLLWYIQMRRHSLDVRAREYLLLIRNNKNLRSVLAKMFLAVYFESLLLSLLFYFTSAYAVSDMTLQDGQTPDYQVLSLIFQVNLVFIATAKVVRISCRSCTVTCGSLI